MCIVVERVRALLGGDIWGGAPTSAEKIEVYGGRSGKMLSSGEVKRYSIKSNFTVYPFVVIIPIFRVMFWNAHSPSFKSDHQYKLTVNGTNRELCAGAEQ